MFLLGSSLFVYSFIMKMLGKIIARGICYGGKKILHRRILRHIMML